jgi:hypothetical protein
VPVAQTRGHAGKALLIASISVVLLLGLGWLVSVMAGRGDVEVRLGDDRFEAGEVAAMAEAIDEGDGLPLLFQDLVNGDRHLFVQHTDPRPTRGWTAFGAFDPDRPECLVEIDRDRKILVNGCDASITYPLDGTGLRYYPTEVDDGELLVDINERTTTTDAREG